MRSGDSAGEANESKGSWLISGLFFDSAFLLLIALYNLVMLVPMMTARTAYLGPGPQFAHHLRDIVLFGVLGFATGGVAYWMGTQEGIIE